MIQKCEITYSVAFYDDEFVNEKDITNWILKVIRDQHNKDIKKIGISHIRTKLISRSLKEHKGIKG